MATASAGAGRLSGTRTAVTSGTASAPLRSTIPARLDRLPWGRFHTRLVIALGVAWVLDGLEITIASAIGPRLQENGVLGLSAGQVGFAASVYLFGEVVGALVFGRLSDKLGRRKLFIATLGLYLVANGITALAFDYWWLLAFRFFAGMGIGGEYAAINSAIDELIPAKHRGHTDLAINGTYWLGAIIGSASTIVLLDPHVLSADLGWRLGLLVGPVIGLAIWGLRRHLPESPRWLLAHGKADEAEAAMRQIEDQVVAGGKDIAVVDDSHAIEIKDPGSATFREIAQVMLRDYRKRTVVGMALGISQSFLYNAIFFTYTLILTKCYGISTAGAAKFLFAFAIGNLLGPLTIGRLFDTVGRRPMIAGTYISSGVLLGVTGWLFKTGSLTATTQTLLWCVIFFIASAAASSAYLTVSEVFPVEIRAQAIAMFFAVWQLVGGVVAPWVFGTLIGTGDRDALFIGYLIGALLMVLGGVLQALFGVEAARRSLEEVARPLSSTVRATGVRPRESTAL